MYCHCWRHVREDLGHQVLIIKIQLHFVYDLYLMRVFHKKVKLHVSQIFFYYDAYLISDFWLKHYKLDIKGGTLLAVQNGKLLLEISMLYDHVRYLLMNF